MSQQHWREWRNVYSFFCFLQVSNYHCQLSMTNSLFLQQNGSFLKVFTSRCYAERGYEMRLHVVCPSVCPHSAVVCQWRRCSSHRLKIISPLIDRHCIINLGCSTWVVSSLICALNLNRPTFQVQHNSHSPAVHYILLCPSLYAKCGSLYFIAHVDMVLFVTIIIIKHAIIIYTVYLLTINFPLRPSSNKVCIIQTSVTV